MDLSLCITFDAKYDGVRGVCVSECERRKVQQDVHTHIPAAAFSPLLGCFYFMILKNKLLKNETKAESRIADHPYLCFRRMSSKRTRASGSGKTCQCTADDDGS